jgi:DNA-binding NarL/FixJ family response regulator
VTRRELGCVLVEDQGLFLEMLGELLGMRGGIRVLEKVQSVAQGKTAAKNHSPDLLILDLELPDGNGLQVARYFLRTNPALRVIILSAHVGSFTCPPWLTNNLQATISKDDTFAQLRLELDAVLFATQVRLRPEQVGKFATKSLTAREAEVFVLIGEGFINKEIALRLDLSEQTIRSHRKRIARKLGTVGTELTRKAMAGRAIFLPKQQ